MDKNMLLHVTVAANYLDIKTLLEYCCRTIADTFKVRRLTYGTRYRSLAPSVVVLLVEQYTGRSLNDCSHYY